MLLADDSASVRTAIEHLLKMEPGITLIGEAANFQEALAMGTELKPNVLLLPSYSWGVGRAICKDKASGLCRIRFGYVRLE